jgi:hypothetical protein
MYKVICKPIIVPLGNLCRGKNPDIGIEVTCHHFDHDPYVSKCKIGFGMPEYRHDGHHKPYDCRIAHSWVDHKEKSNG